MKYTDLILDLYGTLVDIHTEENAIVWEKTALLFGYYGAHVTPTRLKADFQAAMARREAQVGQSYECFPDIPFEQVMAELFRNHGVERNADTLGIQAAQLFRISSTEYIRLYPHVPKALEYLKSQGCRLWMLSNAQRIFTEYELRHLGLGGQFSGIYISSDYGFRKPDARFFQALIEEQRLDPTCCLMIGNDRHTDIAGAKKLGMDTLYMHTNITPADQAKADPSLLPGNAPADCHTFEFEGSDWAKLMHVLVTIP